MVIEKQHAYGENNPCLFGGRAIDPAMVRFVMRIFLVLFALLLLVLRPPQDPEVVEEQRARSRVTHIAASNSKSLVFHLKELGLWELEPGKKLPPVAFSSLPKDLGGLQSEERKRIFLHTLAPTALIALEEVRRERESLLQLAGRVAANDCPFEQMLEGEVSGEQCGLTAEDEKFLVKLGDKYRAGSMDLLLTRVNVVPLSLVLAQGAMESAWGSSRFAREGNNIFGVWTWDDVGMVPAAREQGKTHRVASYDSLLDSVRAYLLMLNRVDAYSGLRQIRREGMDSLSLINGLRYYSEKRGEYVADLAQLIRVNQLQRFDELSLDLRPRRLL